MMGVTVMSTPAVSATAVATSPHTEVDVTMVRPSVVGAAVSAEEHAVSAMPRTMALRVAKVVRMDDVIPTSFTP